MKETQNILDKGAIFQNERIPQASLATSKFVFQAFLLPIQTLVNILHEYVRVYGLVKMLPVKKISNMS